MSQPSLELDKIAAARLWAATRMPYLASALFACVPSSAVGSGTIAVDPSWQLRADPALVAELDAPALGRLMIHLVSHLVRDHAGRASNVLVGDGQQEWWGTCADIEINDDLVQHNCLPPVANAVPADFALPDGRLVESYFETDPPDPDACPDRWDCGSGSDGRPRQWDGDGDGDGTPAMTPTQSDLLRYAIAEDLRRREAEQPGSVPVGWLRWAAAVLPSRTDWRRVLAAEIRKALAATAGSVDYTYRRVSRRSQGTGLAAPRVVLPSMYRPVPNVAVVCDTSGSMDDELLARVLAEVEALLTRGGLRSAGLAALAVDTEVQAVNRVSRSNQVQLLGGGGTDMGAGIAAAAALRPRPDLIVVLTDGFTPWPSAPPPGIRVVIGVLGGPGRPDAMPVPVWARTVMIDE